MEDISSIGLLKEAVFAKYPDISFIAPDIGSARRNNIRGFTKKRNNSYLVEIFWDKDLENSIKGRIVGVIDDMIETGSTMAIVCEKCKELGAKKTVAIITHGVLKIGVDRVKNACDELFLTNTINSGSVNVDVSSLITKSLYNK